MRTAASRLTSVEYESIAVLKQFHDGEIAETVTSTTRVAMKGTKHRISVDIENSTGRSPLHHVIAFDGEEHSFLTERAGVLGLSWTPAEKPLHHPPPILIPYSIIFEAEDRPDFATLLNHSNWEDLASQARLGDRATIDGHECEAHVHEEAGADGDHGYRACGDGFGLFPVANGLGIGRDAVERFRDGA